MSYSFESKRYEKLTGGPAYHPILLADERRLLYTAGHFIKLFDTVTGRTRDVVNTDPYALGSKLTVSKDGRKLYLSLASTEADVWLVSMKPE